MISNKPLDIGAMVMDSKTGIAQGFDTYNDRFKSNPLKKEAFDQRTAGETNSFAIDWIEKNKNEKFFFFLHYFDPHHS